MAVVDVPEGAAGPSPPRTSAQDPPRGWRSALTQDGTARCGPREVPDPPRPWARRGSHPAPLGDPSRGPLAHGPVPRQVHDYLRSKLCSLYENDCIFDKFECAWNGSDSMTMTIAYNNFFRMFDRNTKRDVTLEASRESSKPRAVLKPRRVCMGGKRRRDDVSVDSLDFTKKILHTAWHPAENIIAIAATNNLYIFQDKANSDMH
ncbi:serine/threonine-protein phosphatase 2A 55 kDa regulatory subunit B gamma isoform-like [Carlito syrichta]|uniref:Serine/threonine-protein phosphatase 2A 55 kDa regulatory subunit B gamma isoform-like n=1 Tax=Carlito syrichta TaxID=1868482 RepID=A0A3Q0DPJ1_CARSF|nr:serine/threonine-protein phosphatase 2A 55 kDa regulatory subunit B gamma isoform-like [Carlito syrichta]